MKGGATRRNFRYVPTCRSYSDMRSERNKKVVWESSWLSYKFRSEVYRLHTYIDLRSPNDPTKIQFCGVSWTWWSLLAESFSPYSFISVAVTVPLAGVIEKEMDNILNLEKRMCNPMGVQCFCHSKCRNKLALTTPKRNARAEIYSVRK